MTDRSPTACPRSWWAWLGAAELLGVAGLPAGLAVYFVGAVVTVVRVRSTATPAVGLV
ncbi:hypothetical protein [Streptomyces sp. NPDC049879]|uniref:hypothetical protein n=1 Tax=Streptomyces sp. NPDC049879 TaxID=3365598 RepID=UPI003788598A